MLRFLTAGESHGPSQVAILEGMVAGLPITKKDIENEMKKRQSGPGRGGRGKIEKDKIEILSGVRFGKTIGSPIALLVKNLDYKNWQKQMSIEPLSSCNKNLYHSRCLQSSVYVKVTNPRPGHADLAGSMKYHSDDIRNILERASARETVMRVAIGAICKKFLSQFKIEITSRITQIGKVKWSKSPSNKEVIKVIFEAIKKIDTLGGVIEVIAKNVPPGIGSHVHYDRKLDARLAQALMSIPSVKAVEIGEIIEKVSRFGSEFHDEIYFTPFKGLTFKGGYFRKTNRAGGVEGGISNGEDIVCRVYLKPLSTLGNPLNTVDLKTKKETKALIERSDICVVPRAGAIAESMMAFVLADAFLEKFGGDHLDETKSNFEGYIKSLRTI